MNPGISILGKLIIVLSALGVTGLSIAQGAKHKDEISPSHELSFSASQNRDGGSGIFAVIPKTPDQSGRAVQFRIHYDPNFQGSINVQDCLANLPDRLKGSLNSCRNIPDKSLIQVVISDLSNQGGVPANLELGIIEFDVSHSPKDFSRSLSVADVHVADPTNGSANKEVVLDVVEY